MLVRGPFDAHAKCLQGAQRGKAVLAREKARDLRIAVRYAAKHQRAMGDGLVTGDGELARDGATRTDQVAGPCRGACWMNNRHVTHKTARG